MSQTGCSAEITEPFALRVIGDSMRPEFEDGHIIIIDPGLPICHEAFVVIDYQGETLFGQYLLLEGQQWLHYLNPAITAIPLKDAFEKKGLVVQRSTGRRKDLKHYNYPG